MHSVHLQPSCNQVAGSDNGGKSCGRFEDGCMNVCGEHRKNPEVYLQDLHAITINL